MKKIALTGNIASGKSQIENFFSKANYPVLDTDMVCRELLENDRLIISQAACLFKDYDIFLQKGKFDRKKISQLIFSDEHLKKGLEGILHPKVREEILKFFKNNTDKDLAVVSVPLLFEAKMENLFDSIIFVSADEKIRLQRLKSRNNMDEKTALARINAQDPELEKILKSDFVIENNADLAKLYESFENILQELLKM
ncbi:MAG: dephospho-CoA kinase [Candidatus Gastranaerophilales bacterium]|nr:dephospho-CoA kinase [Candidatus Gastranaerophilales bacterium]